MNYIKNKSLWDTLLKIWTAGEGQETAYVTH